MHADHSVCCQTGPAKIAESHNFGKFLVDFEAEFTFTKLTFFPRGQKVCPKKKINKLLDMVRSLEIILGPLWHKCDSYFFITRDEGLKKMPKKQGNFENVRKVIEKLRISKFFDVVKNVQKLFRHRLSCVRPQKNVFLTFLRPLFFFFFTSNPNIAHF